MSTDGSVRTRATRAVDVVVSVAEEPPQGGDGPRRSPCLTRSPSRDSPTATRPHGSLSRVLVAWNSVRHSVASSSSGLVGPRNNYRWITHCSRHRSFLVGPLITITITITTIMATTPTSSSSGAVPMTLGMRLDALIESASAHLKSPPTIVISPAHVYVLFVTCTVAACVVLLRDDRPPHHHHTTTNHRASTKTPGVVPQKPAWAKLLRCATVLTMLAFGGSVVVFFQESYWNEDTVLYKFLVGWSLCLGYFFSFAGVSLVYDLQETNTGSSSRSSSSSSTSTAKEQPSGVSACPKVVHPAATCAPVCSDPSKCVQPSHPSPSPNYEELSDAQVANLVRSNALKDHLLETKLDCHRAVAVRRLVVQSKLESLSLPKNPLEHLPSEPSLDYTRVHGANCEIVVGYIPLPVGMVGPLTLNGETVYCPMATTEGCLVASTNRGCKAISQGGGASARVIRDGITRAPCVRLPSAMEAAEVKVWCETPEHFATLKAAFEGTTSFGKLQACVPTVAGRNVYLRLTCFAGDAMGMNMVSKGSLAVIETLTAQFPQLQLVALSGNMCTDKKAAAINWIEGRGKSVVVEATIPKEVVKTTLKTNVASMVHTNVQKNLIGSAMAGVVGGFNAHAANNVTAIFLATGQDPAQNVESSNCITLLEETDDGDLWISCTMPSIEVGTVGGGTSLPAQAACLQAIGCRGGGATPGENAQKLAQVVAAATMAGELSLLAALAANTLVAAHMTHNRKPQAV